MSQASPDAEDHDEGLGPSVPEPPRRVPFAVTVTAALLGLVAVLLLMGAAAALTTNPLYEDSIAEAAAEGLTAAAIAVSAALVAAVAWSFVRNGNTVGPMVVGVLLLLGGLIGLGDGVISEGTDGLRVGVVALVLGLGVLLVPLLGHGPSYLAARRVWSKAEREWLHDLATPEAPPRMPYQPQWGAQPPPPQPPWGAPPPQQPAYPQQYQYPPQPNQLQPGQPWPGPQQPQQHEAWHQAAVPGPAWTAQPSAQASAPPAPPATTPPAIQPSATPAAPQQAETPAAPYAAAQQAPTEHIRTQGPPPPQGEAAPPQQPS